MSSIYTLFCGLLCVVLVMSKFLVDPWDSFTHILQGCLAGTWELLCDTHLTHCSLVQPYGRCQNHLYFKYLVQRPKFIAPRKLCLIEGGSAICCQTTWSILVRAIACNLFYAKPLPRPTPTYLQRGLMTFTPWTFFLNAQDINNKQEQRYTPKYPWLPRSV